MEEYRSNMNILKEVLRGKRPHDDVEFVAWCKEPRSIRNVTRKHCNRLQAI